MRKSMMIAAFATAVLAAHGWAGTETATATVEVRPHELHQQHPTRLMVEAMELPVEDVNREQGLLKALEAAPNYADAAHRLGGHYQSIGKYDLAEQYFDRAMANDPHNGVYAERRWKLYRLMGRHNEGITAFVDALQEDATRTHLIGGVVFLLHDLEQYDRAISYAEQWTAAEPENADAYFWLGKNLRATDRYEEATAALHQAVAIDMSIPHLKETQLVYLDSQDHTAGIEYFQKLSNKHPENDQILLFLSELHRANDNLSAATTVAEQRAELLGPDTNVDAINTVASMLEAGGNLEDALSKLFTAERIKQHPEFVHDRIKDIILKLDRVDDGIDYFRRQVKLEPHAHMYRILGELTYAQDDFERAAFWFSKFVEAKPYSALGYAKMGLSLDKLNSDQAALESFQKAAWFDLGIRDNFFRARTMYLRTDQATEGIAFFEQAAAYMPDKYEVHLYLADLYQAEGMLNEAAASLTTARDLKPVTLGTPEIAARLAALMDNGQ